MTSQQAQQYLDSFINHELHLGKVNPASFKLERVTRLLKNLGDPHKDLNIIHVAGSKGKGSICALTASILKEAGYRVGLYTSPHINHRRERIRILSLRSDKSFAHDDAVREIFPDCISGEELCVVLAEIKKAVENLRAEEELGDLTFFEVYTALALYYFHKQKTDFVILEAGLGGRLDATNAADSIIAVIAPISLEHTNILGDTIGKIAQEKAAIIKNRRQKVVISPQNAEARDVIEKRCREFDIQPIHTDQDVVHELVEQDLEGQTFNVYCRGAINRVSTVLLGRHQRDNAVTSIGIIEHLGSLGFAVSEDAIQKGLKNVFWPGRFEIIKREPLVILDSAHNTASAKVLSETMGEISEGKNVILILGISDDKDKESMCDEFKKITEDIIFTKADHPRASRFDGVVTVGRAIDLALKKVSRKDIILITGSVFVVAEARRIINECGTGDPLGRPYGIVI